MGWFDDPDESEPAVQHALKIARKKSLPVTARSRTLTEYLGQQRKAAYIAIGIFAFFAGGILLGLAFDSGLDSQRMLPWVAAFVLACGLLLYFGLRWKMRREGAYRDPGLEVDVGADGIIVRGTAGAYGQRWNEIEAQPMWISIKNGIHFTGLWVQSAHGWVQLTEGHYHKGLAAAALIVRGMHDDFHARQRARVERIG